MISRFSMACLLASWILLPSLCCAERNRTEPFVIGGKNFTEQHILGEIMAQLIEGRLGWRVDRRFGLGGTKICFDALVAGEIHIYPEYTGTVYVSLLDYPPSSDKIRVFRVVQRDLSKQFDLAWMAPFGFSNSYSLTVRRSFAQKLGLEKVSDLVPHMTTLRVGTSQEFHVRPDGLPGLARHYGLKFNEPVVLDPGLTYKACAEDQVDVIDAYTTDGRIEKFGLKILQDDRHFFPPYDCVPLLHQRTLAKHPELVALLGELGGLITGDLMRSMNYQVDEEGIPVEQIARKFLIDQEILEGESREVEARKGGFFKYLIDHRAELFVLIRQHLTLTGLSVLLAALVAIPLGIFLSRDRKLAVPVMGVVNVIQTIPSLALLGFLIPVMGIGLEPAVTALFLYALLPIVRNTYTGITGIEPELLEAGRGIGLTDWEILRLVELPLAFPVIMAGIRTSTVINIGTATLAALIGAGGLGQPIFQGIATVDGIVILFGALPAAGLAVIADLILGGMQHRLSSRCRRVAA